MHGDTQNVPRGWLVTGQAAKILGCSPRYVSRLVDLGLLDYRLIGPPGGGLRLYWEDQVRAYKAGHPKLGATRRLARAS